MGENKNTVIRKDGVEFEIEDGTVYTFPIPNLNNHLSIEEFQKVYDMCVGMEEDFWEKTCKYEKTG